VSGAKKLYSVIVVLAILGFIDSAYALHLHYAKSATSFCDIGETFNCDVVNQSVYSSLFGIPVALIGMLGYVFLGGLAALRRQNPQTSGLLLLASSVGLMFALYLTYVEAYLLATWCILCLASLALISAITLLATFIYTVSRRPAAD
jgi:uncharacterized membrane protein